MARLPFIRKRRSRRARALDIARGMAKAIVVTKLTSVGARAAKGRRGRRLTARLPKKPLIRAIAVPAAAGGGVIAWRKLSGRETSSGSDTDPAASLGPVASAAAVSPPPTDGSSNDAPVGPAPTFADETT